MSEDRVSSETQPVYDPVSGKFVQVPRPVAVSGDLAPVPGLISPAFSGSVDWQDENELLRSRVSSFLQAAPENVRNQLYVQSGFRTMQQQAEAWERSGHGTKFMAAPPGQSWHEYGKAADWKFGSQEARDWAHRNAPDYGLVFPFQSGDPGHMQLADIAQSPRNLAAGGDSATLSVGGAGQALLVPSWVPENLRGPIVNAARTYGVDPTLLSRVVGHESSFNQGAVSSKGAIGLGQLMPGTAKELGVDPSDPNENLMGAAKYLRQMLDHSRSGGDVNKALMMYVGGPGADFSNPEVQKYPGMVLGYGGGGAGVSAGVGTGGGIGGPLFTPTSVPDTAGGGTGVAPALAQGLAQQDQRQRTLMALSMMGAMNRGVTFHPVDYDPWANISVGAQAGRPESHMVMPQSVGAVGRRQLGPMFDPTMERVGSVFGMGHVLPVRTPEPVD